ncbi:hypothetical protein HMPREF0208_00803 [Citrobacter koseri]|uniref:Uncharacterized protein n=1 Tax=Citrobacter koseri (strain ATCC BAA-895 / CDC 4225-83 / SGSC4696) TaxID=290338 RepID=A8ADF2_CITK8|nr:hypothetical protein CKO_00352 [Citrobacter koseri ATCC BAA-895]KXA04782.1 hypothetical protein HMPREF3220_00048 [Citrobacter koseri]KXA05138.1 hypothetical protein HMPREF3207_00974 [Citrobacter koseri]KXB46296.1 hypothetical protein HMPREF0208_00803 [Citrobacter koseri]
MSSRCYIVSRNPLRLFVMRIVLLFISIRDNPSLCHFFRRFASDIG